MAEVVEALHAWGKPRAAATVPVYSPVTGEPIARAAVTRAADAARMVADLHASHEALQTLTYEDVAGYLAEAADVLFARESGIVEKLILDAGMTREEAAAEVARAVGVLERPPRPSATLPALEGFEAGYRRLPGVAAVFAPYTSPLAAPAAAAAYALTHGMPVLVKPSMKAPLATVELVRALHEAGLGRYVSLAVGPGGRLGGIVASDPRVRAVISYTSPQTSLALRRLAPRARLLCNSMGRTIAVVLPGVDYERVGRGIAARRLRHAGQSCASPAWVIGVGEAYEPVVDAVLDVFESTPAGDPRKPGAGVGPLIARYLVEKAERLAADAAAKGAQPLAGGTAWGLYYPPTLLEGTPKAADVLDFDVPAPLLAALKAGNPKEAAGVADSVRYATAVEVYASSIRDVDEVTGRLEHTIALVNIEDWDGVYARLCLTPSSLPEDPASIAQPPIAGLTLREKAKTPPAEEDLY